MRRTLKAVAYILVALALFPALLLVWGHVELRFLVFFTFLLFGLWSWKRGWRSVHDDRRDRQRRWRIRRRVNAGDRLNVDGEQQLPCCQ